ncbi:MAG: hypothetical protein LBE14_00695, partial [Treponema sp.]|nr:hypothetical protein [Treponema sp.]
MRPIDHFFSRLTRLYATLRPGTGPDSASADRLRRDFIALVGPVTGAVAAEELFIRARERLEKRGGGGADAAPDQMPKTRSALERPGCRRFGSLAAFFLGEFDGASMSLEDDDWEDIRETLEEVSGEINMDT